MKCALIFPPTSDPTQPYSSLPCLSAFLHARGNHTAIIVDANVEFFRTILTPAGIIKGRDRVQDRLTQLEELQRLEPSDASWYRRAMQSLLKSPFIIDGIGQAMAAISKPETFSSLGSLNECKRIINEAVELLSCAWEPVTFKLGGAGDLHFATPADVGRLVEKSDNPYTDFLKTHTLRAIRDVAIVGISITYRDQILPAFTLSRLIRSNMPGLPVIFGGNLPSIWYEAVENCPEIFDWCDYLIAFEGETALESLLTAIDTGTSLERVPNLVYRDGGKIVKTEVRSERLSDLPTPDYNQLPLHKYLAPEPVFFVYTSRGCYWSRCEFCSVSPSMYGTPRIREPDLVHCDISSLHEKYNARYFSFADDCIQPKMLLALSDLLIKNGPKISWQCEVRFESAFDETLLAKMKEAGCKNLIFGLESFSESVLKKMNKGVNPECIRTVLEACRRVGIAFNLQFFFGFPGESKTEAEITQRFIEEQAYGPATFSFGIFELHKNSPVSRHSDKYNITLEDTFNPLSIILAYGPKPSHAIEVKTNLQEYLSKRTHFPHAGLSLNAHTIIFLAQTGVQALSTLYTSQKIYKPKWQDTLSYALLTPGSHQHIKNFKFGTESFSYQEKSEKCREKESRKSTILYDYILDSSVEISDLTVSILERFCHGLSLMQIIDEFTCQVKGEGAEELKYVFTEIVRILYEKRFLCKEMS